MRIDSMKQNKATYIVNDLLNASLPIEHGGWLWHLSMEAKRSALYRVLLNRGVFKWFAARRDLIKFKNRLRLMISYQNDLLRDMKKRIVEADAIVQRAMIDGSIEVPVAQAAQAEVIALTLKRERIRGEMNAYVFVRQELRGICHSPRARFADNDSRARDWFRRNVEE